MPCDVVDCTDIPEVYADVVDFDVMFWNTFCC